MVKDCSSPTSVFVSSLATTIEVIGTGFTTGSVVQWNGVNLTTSYAYYYTGTSYSYSYVLFATVPASDLTTAGTATLTVTTPNATPSVSNAVTVSITNPPVPTLATINPSGGPINTASAETLTGTGFTTVSLNGSIIPSTFVNSTEITTNFPASALATPGNQTVTVTTTASRGGTSGAQVYTTFISIPNNDHPVRSLRPVAVRHDSEQRYRHHQQLYRRRQSVHWRGGCSGGRRQSAQFAGRNLRRRLPLRRFERVR